MPWIEIDEASFNYAKENVEWNQLQDRISLRLNGNPSRIFMLEDTRYIQICYGSGAKRWVANRSYDRKYAFCMCNPPFYESKEEVDEGLENKELEPSSVSIRIKLLNYPSTHFDKDLHRFNKWNDHSRRWTTIYWSNHQGESWVQGSNHESIIIIIILWPWNDVQCLHVFLYRWYTSLIGLKKTIKPITQQLKANNVSTNSMRMMEWI